MRTLLAGCSKSPSRTFSATQSKNAIFALLHFSNTWVFEKWRSVPRPHRRLLKNEFFSSLLSNFMIYLWEPGKITESVIFTAENAEHAEKKLCFFASTTPRLRGELDVLSRKRNF